MTIAILILFTYSISTFAKECQLIEIISTVRTQKDHFVLIIASGTLSEKIIKIPQPIQYKFAPYINNTVETNLIMDELKIKEVKTVVRVAPDPLNQGTENIIKNKGQVPCP